MYRRRQTNNRHFTAVRSFTSESLAAEAKHTFEGKLATVGGITESIRLEVPIHTRDHKREHFCLVTLPKFKECKDDLHWTWPITFARFNKCLDQELKDIWDAIVTRDYNTNALKTQANFTAATKKLISESIPMEHPRNQIRDLLDNMQKPNDMTPTQLWHRMGELRVCCRCTDGTTTVPSDDDLKAKLIRALPQAIRFELEKQNISASNDITEILRLADVCDEQYQAEHRSSQSNSRSRGRGNNRQDNESSSRTDRSRSRSRAPTRNRRDDNRSNNSGNNSGPDSQCRLPGHQGHLWRDCFQNPRGNNYRGGSRGGRGGPSSRSSGGRGGNHSNSSRSNSQSTNNNGNGNNRSESHHVAQQPAAAPAAASAAGSQARPGAVPQEIGGHDVHAITWNANPTNYGNAEDGSYYSLFSSVRQQQRANNCNNNNN